MTISAQEAANRRRTRLSYGEIRRQNPNWDDLLVEDYLQKQDSIDTLESEDSTLAEQVQKNTDAIADLEPAVLSNTLGVANNADNIATNTDDIADNSAAIATNTSNISSNASSIGTLQTDLSDHVNSNSQHGVTGDNVGTEDFAQDSVGGVVLLAALVADAAGTASSIALPDLGSAPATYDQTYTQETANLVNECKAQINNLVADSQNAINQLNALLQSMKDANQMNTV